MHPGDSTLRIYASPVRLPLQVLECFCTSEGTSTPAPYCVVLGKSLVRSESLIPRVQNGRQSTHLRGCGQLVQCKSCVQNPWTTARALHLAGPFFSFQGVRKFSQSDPGSATRGLPLSGSRLGWEKRFPPLFTKGLGTETAAERRKRNCKGRTPLQLRGRAVDPAKARGAA